MAFRDPEAAALARAGEMQPRLADAERTNSALVAELRSLEALTPAQRRRRWIRRGATGIAGLVAAVGAVIGPERPMDWIFLAMMASMSGSTLWSQWTVHAPVDRALILRRGRRRRVLAPGAKRFRLPWRATIDTLSTCPFPVQATVETQGARLLVRGLVAVGLAPEQLQRAAEQEGASSPTRLAVLASALVTDAASLAFARAAIDGTGTDDWRGTALRAPLEAALATVGLELLALTVTRER